MSRSQPEWIGKTDDTPVPPHVRLRVYDKDDGVCQCGCTMKIRFGQKWETDHTEAIVNGGQNRESNLRTLLAEHHKAKTADDVAEKSAIYKTRIHHLGIEKPKGRPMPGSRASGLRKRMNGTVERRT